jgi:predicted  nucleic acid-binding Zn-ribbon protein
MIDQTLEALLILQDADMRRKGMEQRLAMLPKEMDAIIARRDKLNASTAAAAEALKKEELSVKSSEAEIARLTSESEKLQQQSALVKKNNEYQAMLAQIADNKRKIGEIEEELLLKFDNVAALKEKAEQVRKSNALELRNARTEFEELLEFSKTVKEEIARAAASRPALTRNVPEEMLATYERLLRGKDNTPPVARLSNGCCGNCHMRVTNQTVNELSKGKIESCDNCQHLLYADMDNADE